jgi:hypothetical protein
MSIPKYSNLGRKSLSISVPSTQLTQSSQTMACKVTKAMDKLSTAPCKLEIVLKITTLPTPVRTVKNGWKQFMLNGEGQRIRIKIRPKAWRKLYQASQQWPAWAALIRGNMGNSLNNGFEMLNPTVQIFEQFSSDSPSIAPSMNDSV